VADAGDAAVTGSLADGWLGDVASRRLALALLIVGVAMAGYTVYAMRIAWRRYGERRERNRPMPEDPVYVGSSGPHAIALGVGAFRAVAAGEPVDDVGYRRSRRQVRVELTVRFGGTEDHARESVPRALRALLGGDAENAGPGMALAEQALRLRARVGPELWQHSLEEYATARGLPFGERESLLALANDIAHAEDRLRLEGLLGHDETVPSLLATHWADGVHLVRCAMRAEWLAAPQGLEYLARADELTRARYPSWSTMFGALLLPALLNDNTESIRWQFTVAPKLVAVNYS